MFKKTRRKIVAAIMLILIAVFIAMLAAIYISSYNDTVNSNMELLKRYTELYSLSAAKEEGGMPSDAPELDSMISREPEPPRRGEHPIEDTAMYKNTAFYAVAISESGQVLDVRKPSEAYTHAELSETAERICAQGRVCGTLDSCIYYKADKGGYTLVAFMYKSSLENSITSLFKYTLICGTVVIAVFFFLASELARRIVKPLEESHARQKQFISDAGHELKTPISVVNANAELLSRELGDNKWLANIQYENERMGALVTQLLELARAESVQAPFEPLELSRLVCGEALPFESVAFEGGKRLICDIEEGVWVCGSCEQLRQLTAILLDNAIEHAPEKSEIALTLRTVKGQALLSVVNPGEAFTREQAEHIFDRFYRTDSARTDICEHYGLGLAIAKAIVLGHHGRLTARCYDGKVCFTAELPL